MLLHGRQNQLGQSGHGLTNILAERTSLQGYRSCGQLKFLHVARHSQSRTVITQLDAHANTQILCIG